MVFWSFFIVLLWIRISQNHYIEGSGRVWKSSAFASRLKNFSRTLIEILIRKATIEFKIKAKIIIFHWFCFFPGLLSFLVLVYRVVIIFSPYIRAFVLRLRYRRVKRECIGKIIHIKSLKCAQIWPKIEFIYWRKAWLLIVIWISCHLSGSCSWYIFFYLCTLGLKTEEKKCYCYFCWSNFNWSF